MMGEIYNREESLNRILSILRGQTGTVWVEFFRYADEAMSRDDYIGGQLVTVNAG